MDGSKPVPDITDVQLRSFHWMDRNLFKKLVIDLCRDPIQSMNLISFWLWLEELGYSNFVYKVLSQSDYMIINSIAEEGLKCLSFIFSQTPPPSLTSLSPVIDEIPMTKHLVKPNDISFEFLFLNRTFGSHRIPQLIGNELHRAFEDIIKEFSMENASITGFHLNPIQYEIGSSSSSAFVTADSTKSKSTTQIMTTQTPTQNVGQTKVQKPAEIPLDLVERTLIVTFSQENRVSPDELKSYFTGIYGNWVEKIKMEDIPCPDDKESYAVVLFKSRLIKELFLDGNEIIQFKIGGRVLSGRAFPKDNK